MSPASTATAQYENEQKSADYPHSRPLGLVEANFGCTNHSLSCDLQLKVTVTVRLLTRSFIVHVSPDEASQPPQPARVKPALGEAVRVTVVPLAKAAVQVAAQLIPAGELVTDPDPEPPKSTVRDGPEPPLPVKQMTLAVILAVTAAP